MRVCCFSLYFRVPSLTFYSYSLYSIVEFASHEDAMRAVKELSESPLLGRPVFIREVC